MPTTRPIPRTEQNRVRLPAPPKDRPRRRSRWSIGFFILLGLCVLAGSIVGATNGFGNKQQPEPKPKAPPISELREIVGFGHVDVPRGVTFLLPARGGRVQRVDVKENQKVSKDTILIQLDDFAAQNQLMQAKAGLATAQANLEKAKRGPAQHQKMLAEKKTSIDAVAKDLKAAQVDMQRLERLVKVKQASKEELEEAQFKIESLQKQVEAKRLAVEALELVNPQDEIRLAQTQVDLQNAQVKLAERAVEECQMKAPYDGFVLRLMANVGDTIGPEQKQPALIFCSNEKPIVRAEIEQEFAHLVEPGMLATLTDDARSSRQWKGNVTRVSRWFSRRRSLLFEPGQFNDVRTLECIVELDEGHDDLRIGQRIRVILTKKDN